MKHQLYYEFYPWTWHGFSTHKLLLDTAVTLGNFLDQVMLFPINTTKGDLTLRSVTAGSQCPKLAVLTV